MAKVIHLVVQTTLPPPLSLFASLTIANHVLEIVTSKIIITSTL